MLLQWSVLPANVNESVRMAVLLMITQIFVTIPEFFL